MQLNLLILCSNRELNIALPTKHPRMMYHTEYVFA